MRRRRGTARRASLGSNRPCRPPRAGPCLPGARPTARFPAEGSAGARPEARALITTGLYSNFRNPIYTFGGVAYLGPSIAWRSVIPLVLFCIVYPLYQSMRARRESTVLEKAFGEEYRRYKANTWM